MAPGLQPTRPTLHPGQRLWSSLSVLSKQSFRSFTSSAFEADDERSSSSGSQHYHTMGSRENDMDLRRPAMPLHAGHDGRPTSRKELLGWYAYSFASETYVICGIASFIPILLETLARENGVLLSDHKTPCGSSDSKQKDDGQCIVWVLGMEVNTASFAMYTFSVSVLLQALLVVSISCAADHGNYRKKLLLTFAWVGSLSVMAYIFVTKEHYIVGALLTILSNTSFGASFVLLNSFLPLLVRYHPEVIEANLENHQAALDPSEDTETDTAGEQASSVATFPSSSEATLTTPLLTEEDPHLKPTASHAEVTSKELELSTRISAMGIGVGYGAALFVQCLSIGVLIAMHNTTWAQRVVLFMIGLWWAVFTFPAALWLRPRPGPPLYEGEGKQSTFAYIIQAWKSLFRTIQLARRLLDIVLFLAGWFLLSDAIATTSSTAVLFAKTSLHMQPWALGMINVISTLAGVIGALGWPWISRWLNLKPHQTILACIALFELIPIYGLLGYLPFVKNWGVFGLQQPWEMYPLAAVYGFVLGGLSSYCRSLYGELIPPGSEAAFYALYAITDKGSSVFGPTIVGVIIDKTGSIRPAFWFLAALVSLPAPLIWLINVERGKREGAKLAERIEGLPVADEDESAEEQRGMLADYDADEDAHVRHD